MNSRSRDPYPEASGDQSNSESPELPDWVEKMDVGHWARISGNLPDLGLAPTPVGTRYLADNDPANDSRLNPAIDFRERMRRLAGRRPRAPWSGKTGFPAITEAWNGAVYAKHFGASGSIVIFGGGHNDYFGSDVHAFDLASRRWARISDGFVSGNTKDYGAGAVYPDSIYPDGSPLPPHTYEYVQYDAAGNDLLLLKGQTELGPDVTAVPIPHMFNLNRLQWRRGPLHPTAILNSGGWTTWDPARRTLWGNSGDDGEGNAFIGFCPDGANDDGTFGSWTRHYPNKIPGAANHNAMALDPQRDLIVVSVAAFNSLVAIDPARPECTVQALRLSEPRPVVREFAAIEYAQNLNAFLYFSARDGPSVYSINAPEAETFSEYVAGEWSWRNLLDRENDIDPIDDARSRSAYGANSQHTFGRFRIASFGSIDVAVLVRHIDSPVYVMKLTE